MKTKRIHGTCAAVLAAMLLTAVATCNAEETKKKALDNTPFNGRDYELKFPDTWEINSSGMMGTDVIGLTPMEGNDDNFRENINVVLENLPEGITAQEYLDANITNMKKTFGLPEDAKFEKVKVGSCDGYHLHYSLKMGNYELDNDVYIVVVKNAAYIITCSNEKGKRDKYKKEMDGVVKTFKLK